MKIKDMIIQGESNNIIDTSTNSPHYIYWKRLGITNENLNFDVWV